LGSIKWRERAKFDVHDLAQLAEARAVIPGAAGAELIALASHGAVAGLGADLVLDAPALLEAWKQ
jgi:hypothetical protein